MTTQADPRIESVLAAYRAAVFEKDVEALMRLYDPSARVFDAWGVWSYEGAAAWRVAVEGWFGSLNDERVRVDFADTRVQVASGMASVSAIVTYAAESARGERSRAMQNRITWVLVESGAALKIVHEHTSAPIGFEDAKAILSIA